MQIDNDQLLLLGFLTSPLNGQPRHKQTALQVRNPLGPLEGTGQAVSRGAGNVKPAEGRKAGMYLAYGRQRIRHISAGIVQRIAAFIVPQIIFILSPLVELEGALRAGIHLLQEKNIRVGGAKHGLYAEHILSDQLLGRRIDAFPAVHEEVRFPSEGAVARVERQNPQRPRGNGLIRIIVAPLRIFGIRRTVLGDRQIAHCEARYQRHGQQDKKNPFHNLQSQPQIVQVPLRLFLPQGFLRRGLFLRRGFLRRFFYRNCRRRGLRNRFKDPRGAVVLREIFFGRRLLPGRSRLLIPFLVVFSHSPRLLLDYHIMKSPRTQEKLCIGGNRIFLYDRIF